MFDPVGVLHAALRVALRRSHECFAMEVESPFGGFRGNIKVDANDFNDVDGKRVIPFFIPPRSPPYGGLQGTITSSPAPPSEWPSVLF